MKTLKTNLLFLTIFLASCTNLQSGEPAFNDIQIPAENLNVLQIQIGEGSLSIEKSDSPDILITTNLSQDIVHLDDQVQGKIMLDLSGSQPGNFVTIKLPGEISSIIESFNANISLNGLSGGTEIRNTAGDIDLVNYQGEGHLKAGRGDIRIKGGGGKLILIGEHGILSIKNFNGPISASTIMGEIEYSAPANPEGNIHLETDHAPVSASLPANSNYQINTNSSGGIVICTGESISRTPTGCRGSTGDSRYILEIRTVSGRIDFRILP